jgi:hypothetical protein
MFGVNGVDDVDIEGLALEPWWKGGGGEAPSEMIRVPAGSD